MTSPSELLPSKNEAARKAITAAISKADESFGYSYRMTSLVDDVATHTLFMDGYEPVSFEDRDDGVRMIEERRNAVRADAVLAALSRPLPAPSEQGECAAAPDHADILETIRNAADDWQKQGYTSALAEVRDMANVGRALMEALPKGYSYMNCPSEIVSDLQNERDESAALALPDREAYRRGLADAAKKCLFVSGVIGAAHGSSIDSALREAHDAILASANGGGAS